MVRLDNEEGGRQGKGKSLFGQGRELTLASWLLAWDAYSLATAALGQMTYPSAQMHKRQIAQIACQAQANGRNETLAVIYDRLVR